MAFHSTTGAKVFIGPVNSTADTVSEYAALTYVEIGELESMSEYGDQASLVTFANVSDARMRKRKGIRDAGDATLIVASDPHDAGQIALIAAEATNFTYAIKVTYPDAPDANDTDSTDYFRALVGSKRRQGIGNDMVGKRAFVLFIDTAITEAPSEAVSGP